MNSGGSRKAHDGCVRVVIVASLCLFIVGRTAASPLSLGFGVGTSHYTHSTATLPPLEFQAGSLEGLVNYDRQTDRSRVFLEARRRLDFYSGVDLNPPLEHTRQTVDRLTMLLDRTWSERDRVDVSGYALSARDVLDIDQPIPSVQSRVTEWGGTFDGTYRRIEGTYRGQGWSYDDPRFQDTTDHGWTVRALPIQLATGAWFVGWNERDLLLGEQLALESHVAATGLRRSLSSGITAELEAGASEHLYNDGTRSAGPEAALALKSQGPGANAVSLRLQVEREFPATLTARLSHAVGDGVLWATGESQVDAEGGYYHDLTVARRVGVGVRDTLARASVIGVEASYAQLRPFRGDAQETELVRASGWLARRMRPWLTARAGCSYFDQMGGASTGLPSFSRLRFDISVTAQNP